MSAALSVIEARGLVKRFGARRAVDGLDLTVPSGTVYGFLGPNGSGKSTTIRMLLGLIAPTAGTARILGHDIRHDRVRALRGVGAQVEAPSFYGYLSGRRNLEFLGALTGPTPRALVDEAIARVRLTGRDGDKVKTYSQGMRARLGLAQALLCRPDLLVLDEPTNGLDPQGMREVRELVRSLAQEDGMSIFISSHLLAEVQAVCDRVAVISAGRLVAEGPVSELLSEAEGLVQLRLVVHAPPGVSATQIALTVPGVTEARVGDPWLLVTAPPTAAAAVNAALVSAGVAVSELVAHQRSLEEFFFQVTGQESSL